MPRIFYSVLVGKRYGRRNIFHTLNIMKNNFSQKVGFCFGGGFLFDGLVGGDFFFVLF